MILIVRRFSRGFLLILAFVLGFVGIGVLGTKIVCVCVFFS